MNPTVHQTPRKTEQTVDIQARTIVSWRALVIGCLLIPVNCYWIMEMEVVRYMDFPTTISLFFNAIFNLLVLVALNLLLRRFTPRWALTQAEMLTIYVMLTLASSLCGHDMVQVLASVMGASTWFATPENRWQELFGRFLPNWALVRDKKVLEGYYLGDSSLYRLDILRGWAGPVFCWCAFIVVMLFVMLCINTLLRKQWAERERLSYPLIALPLAISDPAMSLFRNKLMWIGFGIAGAIDLINGINVLTPSFPAFQMKAVDYGAAFTTRPLNALNPVLIGFYPFVIGLGTLLPVDLSFSCWFFYVFWKMQAVVTSAVGWNDIPRFPYIEFQSFGAYMGIASFALWTSRKSLKEVLKRAVGREGDISDEGEAMSYRTALIGASLGMLALLIFEMALGLSLWVGLLFLLIYFLLSIAITRMRAELGPPAHDLHFAGPDQIVAAMAGTRNLSGENLTGLSVLFWFNRAYRSHPMPIQLESYKIAETAKIGYRRVMIAMMLAAAIGGISSFWALLHLCYRLGASTAKMSGVAAGFGRQPFECLANWFNTPAGTDIPGVAAMAVGTGFTLLLQALRMRFFWFPFHPVGYAVSSSWVMQRLWGPMLLAWLVKLLILRYGGLQAFRRAIPFFLGLILGEFVVGSLWAIIGLVLGIPTYSFFI